MGTDPIFLIIEVVADRTDAGEVESFES